MGVGVNFHSHTPSLPSHRKEGGSVRPKTKLGQVWHANSAGVLPSRSIVKYIKLENLPGLTCEIHFLSFINLES